MIQQLSLGKYEVYKWVEISLQVLDSIKEKHCSSSQWSHMVSLLTCYYAGKAEWGEMSLPQFSNNCQSLFYVLINVVLVAID